jgi:hypothetical protein
MCQQDGGGRSGLLSVEAGFVGQDSFHYRRFKPNNAADRFNTEIGYTIAVK